MVLSQEMAIMQMAQLDEQHYQLELSQQVKNEVMVEWDLVHHDLVDHEDR